MASDLSKLDLLVIQIDGIHMDEDLILVAAIGVDAKGDKHPLGLAEGATENAATVQALIDNLVEAIALGLAEKACAPLSNREVPDPCQKSLTAPGSARSGLSPSATPRRISPNRG